MLNSYPFAGQCQRGESKTKGHDDLPCPFLVFRFATVLQPQPQKLRCAYRKRSRYSPETMNALAISARSKLPSNWFSLLSQN